MKNDVSDRLKRIVELDTSGEVKSTLSVVRADLLALLSEFMNVKDLYIRLEGEEGAYRLTVNAEVSSIYSIGIVGTDK
ncbi:MAG: hypothetical protein J1F33_04270 [Clostridiales bacterium]|nr:hypothetical protein [Clostridiales bacterium]